MFYLFFDYFSETRFENILIYKSLYFWSPFFSDCSLLLNLSWYILIIYHFLFYLPSLPSYSLIQRGINKLSRALFKQNLFDHLRNQVECFFPINGFELKHGNAKNIYWIPDFQDQYFPQFFSKGELAAIQNWRMHISSKKDALLVLSSKAALNDYPP